MRVEMGKVQKVEFGTVPISIENVVNRLKEKKKGYIKNEKL